MIILCKRFEVGPLLQSLNAWISETPVILIVLILYLLKLTTSNFSKYL